jgi:glycosyltransferase involved in cell wall biosynthesis
MGCEVIPSAGRRRVEPGSRLDARSALGLSPDGPIALHFGAIHGGKDVDTVLQAFAGDDAPARLVFAGTDTAARFAAFRDARPELAFPDVIIIDGYVTEEKRDLLYSAADYSVLSFFPEWPNDSGTMGDAIARGMPVCCSDTADNGRLVREYRLGELFESGNAASLRAAAARMASTALAPADQAAFLAEFSPQAQSRRLISVATSEAQPGASWS